MVVTLAPPCISLLSSSLGRLIMCVQRATMPLSCMPPGKVAVTNFNLPVEERNFANLYLYCGLQCPRKVVVCPIASHHATLIFSLHAPITVFPSWVQCTNKGTGIVISSHHQSGWLCWIPQQHAAKTAYSEPRFLPGSPSSCFLPFSGLRNPGDCLLGPNQQIAVCTNAEGVENI